MRMCLALAGLLSAGTLALEAAGERRESVAVSQQGLEVLAKQELTPQQRRDMADLLEARIKRLK